MEIKPHKKNLNLFIILVLKVAPTIVITDFIKNRPWGHERFGMEPYRTQELCSLRVMFKNTKTFIKHFSKLKTTSLFKIVMNTLITILEKVSNHPLFWTKTPQNLFYYLINELL